MRIFLTALWDSNTPCFNPTTCFLMNCLSSSQQLNLTLCFICQRSLYRTETIHIFDLCLDPQILLPFRANRYVGITTQASFLHTSWRNTQVHQNFAQFLHIEPCFFW